MISIDLRSRIAIYEQIKNQIMELILVGALKPHDQLPSIRGLAKDLKINFNTVKKAFGDMETAGVIYSLPGRGCFVSENALGNSEIRQKSSVELHNAMTSARASGLTKEEVLKMADSVFDEINIDGGLI